VLFGNDETADFIPYAPPARFVSTVQFVTTANNSRIVFHSAPAPSDSCAYSEQRPDLHRARFQIARIFLLFSGTKNFLG
jgi:hypothetical protein